MYYTTHDLCLAAVIALYYQLVSIEHTTGAFVFDVDVYLETLLIQYADGNMAIEPVAFYKRLEELRVTQESYKTIHW